jgi:hypothetical protein
LQLQNRLAGSRLWPETLNIARWVPKRKERKLNRNHRRWQ